MMLPSSPPGLSAKDVEKLITAAITEYDQPGKTGWVRHATVPLAGLNAVSLRDVPVDANEIVVDLNDFYPDSTEVLNFRGINASGNVVAAGYKGYSSNLSSSSVSGTMNNNLSWMRLRSSLLSSEVHSATISAIRAAAGTWSVSSMVTAPRFGIAVSNAKTPNMGAGMTGVQLSLGSALSVFVAGTATLSWRR